MERVEFGAGVSLDVSKQQFVAVATQVEHKGRMAHKPDDAPLGIDELDAPRVIAEDLGLLPDFEPEAIGSSLKIVEESHERYCITGGTRGTN
jgi:hypothetical protein